MSEHNKYGNGVKRNLEIFRDDFQRISALDYEEIPEIYVGYNVLVSYLKTQKNKSYRKFLFRNRKTIVDSLLSLVSSLDWLYFDNYWVDHFLKESENLNKSTFVSLKEKVNTERTRYTKNLETYWIGVIKECELRRELSKNEDKKEYVLQTLHDIDEKIQTIREQIAELNNEWNHNHKEEGSLMSINDNPEIQLDDYDPGKDWRVQRRKDKSKAIKNINNDVEIREANSFGIPNDHVFESVPSLITSSSTLSNNNSRSGTLNQVNEIRFFHT
ncbi:hypothetical protein C1645_169313 [Glomus cerebriforme]|uniref:Uncharacterized protein n=1 Tax=Glomus cerebriforme TaxID=658196 RepID=A0A397T1Q7_9GLOM|nr:hypothetical protein C1645_169313 [Glomus cerebriforme]